MAFQRFKQKYRFSDLEVKHLSIGTLLFTAVMVSLFLVRFLNSPTVENLFFIVTLAVITAPLFFLHEIGHKISAQHYNMWAEFRLDEQGAFLTALSIIMPFKIVAPGAVMIRATSYEDLPKMGKISAYGPMINIYLGGIYLILSGAFLFGSLFITDQFRVFYDIFFYGAGFSYFLAIFNMLPFGPLDGKKVKMWNNNGFWLFFAISAIFAVETFIYGIMFGGALQIDGIIYNYFLLGGILVSITNFPLLLLFYPFIIGAISFLLGSRFLQKLKDPYWEPGAQNFGYDNQETDYMYRREPQVNFGRRRSASQQTPMNVPCAECGVVELLPFKCSTCEKLFCAQHRLPGRHFCAIDADKI